MSSQVYYVLARVGADSIGLYVESPDFDAAYNVHKSALRRATRARSQSKLFN